MNITIDPERLLIQQMKDHILPDAGLFFLLPEIEDHAILALGLV